MLTIQESGVDISDYSATDLWLLTALLSAARKLSNVFIAVGISVVTFLDVHQNIRIALGLVSGVDEVVTSGASTELLGP